METETGLLLSSLNDQRDHVLGILDGLGEDALRRPALPSGWSCPGMVQHLTISDERFWFRGIVAGEPVDLTTSEESYAAAWRVAPDVPAEAVFDAYRHEIEDRTRQRRHHRYSLGRATGQEARRVLA